MNARDELADIKGRAEKFIAAHAEMCRMGQGVGGLAVGRPDLMPDFDAWYHASEVDHADTVLAVIEASKPRTITTAEAIKDLPALTMVVYDDTANGGPLEAYVVPDDGTVMFRDRYPFHLLCMNGEYVTAEDMPLPLTVVYEAI